MILSLALLLGGLPIHAATTTAHAAASPSKLSFGNVVEGSTSSLTVQLWNHGSTAFTITKAVVSGAGYELSGLSTPQVVNPGSKHSFTVDFTAAKAGSSSGSIAIGINGASSTLTIPLSGSGVAVAKTASVAATPASLAFGNVVVGSRNTLMVQLWNHGSTAFTITKAVVSGTGYEFSGISTPQTVEPGSKHSFTVDFIASRTGSSSGSIVIGLNGASYTLTIPVSGNVVGGTASLSLSPTSLSFGQQTIGTDKLLTVRLTNTGNASVTISGISTSDPQLGTSGGVNGASLAAGQSATLNVIFTPTKYGSFNGQVKISSNANGSPATISVAGSSVAQSTSHSIALHWDASSSSGVEGYYVYRSTNSSNEFVKMSSSYDSGLSYTDKAVNAGTTYYYAVTAVNSQGVESAMSADVSVTIPPAN